jgi:hypothetical protein
MPSASQPPRKRTPRHLPASPPRGPTLSWGRCSQVVPAMSQDAPLESSQSAEALCVARQHAVQSCMSSALSLSWPLRFAQFIRVYRWSKLVYMVMGKRREGSPICTRSAPKHGGEPQLFHQCLCATNSDTLSDNRCVPFRPLNAFRRRRRPAACGR